MSLSLHKCRLCLRLGRFCSIFEEDDSVKLSEMLTAVADLEVVEGDGLPWHVCGACIESLSAAYVFRGHCRRSDRHLRTHPPTELKFGSHTLPTSYSGLLHQDLHVHSRLDCSVADYDENIVDNNINKDISAHTQPNKSVDQTFHTAIDQTFHTAIDTTDSEIDANTTKCSYCQELMCNVENTHQCGATSSETADQQTSDSDETVTADHVHTRRTPNHAVSSSGEIKCLLCDDFHNSYDDYVSHLLECTANVRIQFYECSACHDLSTSMKSYLQHVKRHFQTDAIQSIDVVDSQRREDELMQQLSAPSKPMRRRKIGWSIEDLDRYSAKPTDSKETRIPRMVKSFLGLQGTEELPKHSSPAKESIRKLIQAGRDKTANYHCFGRSGKKLKKKVLKHRNVYTRKYIERKLFINDDKESLDNSFSTISEVSIDQVDEPIYAVIDKKKKIFMLSDFLKDRETLSRMITELGGEVASNTSMEMRATHFVSVLPRDTCSGMMVCALATGKWMLHEYYVTESYVRGRLLEENSYEWAHHPKLIQLNSTSVEAAKASEFWRLKLQGPTKTFPFQGARVALIMERKYSKYYRFIFKTLKAKVFIYDQSDPDMCRGATHCFVDMKSVQTCDLMFFANHNIPVFPYQYILIYLLKCGKVTDEHKYLLQDYKTLKKQNSRRLNQTY